MALAILSVKLRIVLLIEREREQKTKEKKNAVADIGVLVNMKLRGLSVPDRQGTVAGGFITRHSFIYFFRHYYIDDHFLSPTFLTHPIPS